MELYERVKKCAALMHLSETAFARAIGLKQSTWAGYLNAERQHKLWPLLPAILKEFPRISRQWLYFEEGPAVIGLGTPAASACWSCKKKTGVYSRSCTRPRTRSSPCWNSRPPRKRKKKPRLHPCRGLPVVPGRI